MTVLDLADVAGRVVDSYDQKQRIKGEPARIAHGDEEWSRMIVLLRIDKEARWRAVAPVVTVLREARIFRLQFACSAEADLSYSAEEAARFGVVRRKRMPAPPGWADCKLAFELAVEPAASTVDVRADGVVVGRPGPGVVEIHVDPQVAVKYVVAAVSDLTAGGVPRVHFR